MTRCIHKPVDADYVIWDGSNESFNGVIALTGSPIPKNSFYGTYVVKDCRGRIEFMSEEDFHLIYEGL